MKGHLSLHLQHGLVLSNLCLVDHLPSYRQKLSSAQPVVNTLRRSTNKAMLEISACYDCTDESVLEAAAPDLDKLTDSVTSIINFGLSTKTSCTHNNEPLFTAKLRPCCPGRSSTDVRTGPCVTGQTN